MSTPDDCYTIEAFDSEDAAEEFADYAFGNLDMWEYRGTWTQDYAVAVREIGKTEWELFEIEVESQPVFSASKVKDEQRIAAGRGEG